jgi:SH3 domain-containing YSC84-like protein 1
MNVMMATTLAAAMAIAPLIAKNTEPEQRLGKAAAVLSQIMDAPDRRIPAELLERAHCIVIVPDLQIVPFVLGGKYANGYVACRTLPRMGWSAPGALRIEGDRIGLHIGGSSTDLIMLAMNGTVVDRLLDSKFTLGTQGSVAAGPVGRFWAEMTDAQMHADILTWSRSEGLLAGVVVEGATLHQDLDDNEMLYGKKLENRDIVTKNVRPPQTAGPLLAVLNRYSVKERTQ